MFYTNHSHEKCMSRSSYIVGFVSSRDYFNDSDPSVNTVTVQSTVHTNRKFTLKIKI